LLQVLFRFVEPTAGCCKIDGIDIQTLSIQSVRRAIATIPQGMPVSDKHCESIACLAAFLAFLMSEK
jgi:ABC-type transport system involved in Fe-S cluster assembly fused permease/ATPase subunit